MRLRFLLLILLSVITAIAQSGLRNPAFVANLHPTEAGAVLDDPTDLTGIVAWWKAGSITAIDGAEVASWTDSSGNGHTMTTISSNPIFTNSIAAINNKPIVWFDSAASDDMGTANEAGFMATNFAYGLLFSSDAAGGYVIGKEDTAANYFGFIIRWDATTLTTYITPADNATFFSIGDASFPTDLYRYVFVQWDGSNFKMFTNNTLAASSTPFTQAARTNEVGVAFNAQRTTGSGTHGTFGLADCHFYNRALTDDERNTLYTNYIKATFSLP